MRGYDNYPLGFICTTPTVWPDGALPTNYWELNHNLSGGNPNSVMETQAGAHGRWGVQLPDECAEYTNQEFERVIYKNYISFSTTIQNFYMTYGGTNWGGLASPATLTSYDYGGPIRESRLVNREKYSEFKLLSQFLKVSPALLTTRPLNQYPINSVNASIYTDSQALAVTQLADVVGDKTVFWILRHAAYNSLENTTYKLHLPTSRGSFSIPSLGGSLQLTGRDSKIHLTDYGLGEKYTILYSSGEVLTWKQFTSRTIVVLYGSLGEVHETAFIIPRRGSIGVQIMQGHSLIKTSSKGDVVTLNYKVISPRTTIKITKDFQVVIMDRKVAYNTWVPEWAGGASIIEGPYLIRSAERTNSSTLALRGDLNQTQVDTEIYADDDVNSVTFNGRVVPTQRTAYGTLKCKLSSDNLTLALPDLRQLDWRYIDGLPEASLEYDDSKWLNANLTNSTNPRKPTTPTSLYSSDYGFHTGNILWRGHFTATGKEENFRAEVQGGAAFGFSIYLDSEQITYFPGIVGNASMNVTASLPPLKTGSKHVLVVLQDHMGLEQNYGPGGDLHKIPRGILNYGFTGANTTSISWKVTGNLGGEKYVDRARGPLNEGGLFPERQGFHQPGVNTSTWTRGNPLEGLDAPGVRFYTTTFDLNIPAGLDAPLSFTFANTSTPTLAFRAQLYVNGYQFGKYVNNIGPQVAFPVPEGILNHRGQNTLALSLWALDPKGATLDGFDLVAEGVVRTGMVEVKAVEQPRYAVRKGAY